MTSDYAQPLPISTLTTYFVLMRLASCLSAALAFSLIFGAWAPPALADENPHERLKQHVREVVQEVKNAPTAAKKRSILDEKLRALITALDRAKQMGSVSRSEKADIDILRTRLEEKIDELHGRAEYDAVPDDQLDAFADYVQQDFEQAARTITIGLTTGLLILILLILLL